MIFDFILIFITIIVIIIVLIATINNFKGSQTQIIGDNSVGIQANNITITNVKNSSITINEFVDNVDEYVKCVNCNATKIKNSKCSYCGQ